MRRWLSGWRVSLRMARRDARRGPGRSAIVFLMIALPVLAVVALDVLARTSNVSTAEGLDRQLGQADALVTSDGTGYPLDQDATATAVSHSAEPGPEPTPPTAATIEKVPGVRQVLEVREGEVVVRTPGGLARPAAAEVDLSDPLTVGMFQLTSGVLPSGPDEVVVTDRLAGRGIEVGQRLTFEGGGSRLVVGTVESAAGRNLSMVVGPHRSIGLDPEPPAPSKWLVRAPGGVTWPMVQEMNAEGLLVLSRSVVLDPPPASEVTVDTGGSAPNSATVAILAMIVAMALLEVVLLAGPAFAVGARRQQRALALLIASGGDARQVRRVVLASGVFLGGLASVAGALAGVGLARVAQPFIQRFSDTASGPFEVNLRDVALIAACGLLSAVLAALAPAVIAARQEVVAALAGRRGQGRPALWSPLLGLLLLAAGVTGAVLGATRMGTLYIAGATVLAVVGMVLLTPVVVAMTGRLARVLPLPARFAVRDAARQRSRTAPAVAAVAATVAGVVALGIGASSDAAENRATYTPTGPPGSAVVAAYGASAEDWTRIRSAIAGSAPGSDVTEVHGLDDVYAAKVDGTGRATTLEARAVGSDGSDSNYGSSFGSAMLVGEKSLLALGLDLSAAELADAHQALAAGGVVLFGYADTGATEADVTRVQFSPDMSEMHQTGRWRVPAVEVTVPGTVLPAAAVLSDELVRQAGLPAPTTAVVVDGPFTGEGEDALAEAVTGAYLEAWVQVERGYHDDDTQVALLLLGLIGAVLVLGGTLTATFLALSDARPDFATMSAVGAAPRTRRLVAASYAGAVGLVGALLGAAVGFIPGIAVAYPLTSSSWRPPGATQEGGAPLPDVFIDVPWTLVVVVVLGIPTMAAVCMGLLSRSRLPMVSRIT